MKYWLSLIPLFLLACGVSALPLATPTPANTPSAVVVIVHKVIDHQPDGKAQVIWYDPRWSEK